MAAKIPSVTASVFRTGIGGEVFGYIPNETGCYKCLQLYSELNEINLSDDALGLTVEEQQRIYGLESREFRASGLSIDIQMIALIQAPMALSILLRDSTLSMSRLKSTRSLFFTLIPRFYGQIKGRTRVRSVSLPFFDLY